ncbi:hypothetical protein [Flavobacterium ajazii]|uniref:hypothetical protein n=1 Tax=Flavobacterium ajazii TaxID=2692318 RepID=UPI0013D655BD|nr:hypothetical protein [Flavobacterium ajazii]
MKILNYFTSISLFFFLTNCKKQEVNIETKKDLSTELESSILEYQSKIPIPSYGGRKKFIYIVEFLLNGNDTIIKINRKSKGIFKHINYYGVYKIENRIPVVILDENNLGKKFFKNKIKNSLLKDFQIDYLNGEYGEYPPVYTYIVKENRINLSRIDTISNKWIK